MCTVAFSIVLATGFSFASVVPSSFKQFSILSQLNPFEAENLFSVGLLF